MSEPAEFNCTTDLKPEGDISGRGVRLSFYIQGICLIISALYSNRKSRMIGTTAPFAVTGMVYALCTLILGFKKEPNITVYDAIISTSLSAIALLSIVTLALIYWLKHEHRSVGMRVVLAGHTIFLLAVAVAVTYKIPNFGYHPECFLHIYFVFFGRIPIKTFRLITLVFYFTYLGVFLVFLVLRMVWDRQKRNERLSHGRQASADSTELEEARFRNSGKMIALVVVSLVIYAICMAYVEVLRWYNRGLMGASDGWSFGQIMAFALCIVPVLDTGHIIKRHHDKFGTFNPMVMTTRGLVRPYHDNEKGYVKVQGG